MVTGTTRTSVTDVYQRKKGDQAIYSYAGAYGENSDGVWWLVTVRSNGNLKGMPIGMLVKEKQPTMKVIARLIEEQIENLDQIAE